MKKKFDMLNLYIQTAPDADIRDTFSKIEDMLKQSLNEIRAIQGTDQPVNRLHLPPNGDYEQQQT